MKVSRRGFLKLAGVTGATATASVPTLARASASADTAALLVDTTRCVGCRGCEVACAEQNALSAPERLGDRGVFDAPRATTPEAFTVVNRAAEPGADGEARWAKSQCMHCLEPACASACPARALDKTPEGPVVYHANRCLGCRYCMVACPFEIPRFEYDAVAPRIRKCEMCASRRKDGKGPACAEACPSGALKFGTRAALLDEAKTRVYGSDRYVRHVYGEHEAGGTGVLYLADVAFEKLGLKAKVGSTPYTEYTRGALGLVPFVMTLWPPLLMGIYTFAKGREEKLAAERREGNEEKKHE